MRSRRTVFVKKKKRKEINHLEDLGSDRRIILKRILKKNDGRYEVCAFNSG